MSIRTTDCQIGEIWRQRQKRYSFNSKLSGRKQFCSVNGQESRTENVLCCIPRGPFLGLSFSLFTLMTLRVAWKSPKASKYADDTSTKTTSNDINEAICMAKKEVPNISYCLRVNKLSTNPKNFSSCLFVINVD